MQLVFRETYYFLYLALFDPFHNHQAPYDLEGNVPSSDLIDINYLPALQ